MQRGIVISGSPATRRGFVIEGGRGIPAVQRWVAPDGGRGIPAVQRGIVISGRVVPSGIVPSGIRTVSAGYGAFDIGQQNPWLVFGAGAVLGIVLMKVF